jgi:hypothetical protein
MSNFTLKELTHYACKTKVFALGIDERFPFIDFVQRIKKDPNFAAELGDLVPAIKYFANGTKPFLPNTRFKKLEMGKKFPYSVYEVKSDHLRSYLFTESESGIINILGGDKKNQPKDLNNIKRILKEYHLFTQSSK